MVESVGESIIEKLIALNLPASFSDQKLKTNLRVLEKHTCNSAYPKAKLNLGPEQICTGGSGRSDSCRGDSGNGLFEVVNGKHYVQGIVSVGSNSCGNEQWPSISTKVAYFIDWIDMAMMVVKRTTTLERETARA